MTFKKIVLLDNQIEADIFEEILNDNNIPHVIRSYDDTAYGSLYQLAKGWGKVEAPSEYEDKIKELLNELRQAKIEE